MNRFHKPLKKYEFVILSVRLPIIFFIIGILVINILSLCFISILGLPPPPFQLAYSSNGEEGEGKEGSEEKGNGDSTDKSSSEEKSPISLPPGDDDNQEEEEDNTEGNNPPSSPSKEKKEPPASFQNPRLVPPSIPLAAGSDDNNMPTSSISSSPSPTSTDQLLPLQISNLCSDKPNCGTLKILMNYVYSNTNRDIPVKNIITINIQRNNQSISSFTLNNNDITTSLLIDPGQYDIIANAVDGSTTISKISADCSGILKAGEIKTCTITI